MVKKLDTYKWMQKHTGDKARPILSVAHVVEGRLIAANSYAMVVETDHSYAEGSRVQFPSSAPIREGTKPPDFEPIIANKTGTAIMHKNPEHLYRVVKGLVGMQYTHVDIHLDADMLLLTAHSDKVEGQVTAALPIVHDNEPLHRCRYDLKRFRDVLEGFKHDTTVTLKFNDRRVYMSGTEGRGGYLMNCVIQERSDA